MRPNLLRLSCLIAGVFAGAVLAAGCQRNLYYLSTPVGGLGATATPERSAVLQTVAGSVEIRSSGSAEWAAASTGQALAEGSQVRTGPDGHVAVHITEGSTIYIGSDTELAVNLLNPYLDSLLTALKLERGQVWILLRDGLLDVETPHGIATARNNAYLSVDYQPKSRALTVMCLQGLCGFGSVLIPEGYKLADAVDNLAPERLTMGDYGSWGANVAEATQWAFLGTEAAVQGSATMIIVATGTPTELPPTSTATEPPSATPTRPVASATPVPVKTATPAAASSATRAAATPTRAPTSTPAQPPRTPLPSPTEPTRLPTVTRPPFTPLPPAPIIGRHRVLAGETVFCIARGYGVLPAAIAQANGLSSTASVFPGDVLAIPEVQWRDILPGPVCPPQFVSPFPGLPVATATSAGSPPPPLTLSVEYHCISNCDRGDGSYTVHFELRPSGGRLPYTYQPAQSFDLTFAHCTDGAGRVSVTSADGQTASYDWTFHDVSCPTQP